MEKVYKYTITNQEIFENIFKDEKILMNHVVVPPGKVFPKHPTDAAVYVLITKPANKSQDPKQRYFQEIYGNK